MFCLHVSKWTVCMPDHHGGQKRVLEPLELDLEEVVSGHVGVRPRRQSSAEAAGVLDL